MDTTKDYQKSANLAELKFENDVFSDNTSVMKRQSSLQCSNSTARLTYRSPRALHIENVEELSTNGNNETKFKSKFLVGDGRNREIIQQQMNDELEKDSAQSSNSSMFTLKRERTSLSRSKSLSRNTSPAANHFSLHCKPVKNINEIRNDTTHSQDKRFNENVQHLCSQKYSNNHATIVNHFEVTPLQRSKSELEIMNQANVVLQESGIKENNVLKQGMGKLEKRLNNMYLNDYSPVTSEISLKDSRRETKNHKIHFSARKHIYLSQIPSLLNRGSLARRSMHSLRDSISLPERQKSFSVLNLHSSRMTSSQLDKNPPQSSQSSGLRRPLVIINERSAIDFQDHFHQKKSRCAGIGSSKHWAMKGDSLSINVEGSPMCAQMTTKRVM